MRLIADRFIVTSAKGAFDLATGGPVILRVMTAGDAAEEVRWAIRCDTLHQLRHPLVAPLLDYGAATRTERFEAWPCGPVWTGAAREADRVIDVASAFWRVCGLAPGDVGRTDVHSLHGRAVVVPACKTGYAAEEAGRVSSDPASCGFWRICRRADDLLADVFDRAAGPRPRVVQIRGSGRSGRTEVVLAAARAARQRGFIPINIGVLHLVDRGLIERRSLCLIDEDGAGSGRWRAVLSATLSSAQAHVLLVTGHEEVRGVHSIALDRVPPETLLAAVRPHSLARDAGVIRAVRRAQGLPGRFADLLWGRMSSSKASIPMRGALRAAEQRAVYEGAAGSRDVREAFVDERPQDDGRAWPAPGELATLRRRLAAAKHMVVHGRHAPGLRQLRQALGALARRDDWTHAVEGALTLAASLAARGRPREAHEALDEARRYADRRGDDRALLDIAVLKAHACIDLVRLDEAETAAGAALMAAQGIDDGPRVAAASLAMSRCLFWRGRYADAEAALGGSLPDRPVGPAAVRQQTLGARVAVGLGDLPRAGLLAYEASEHALRLEDPGLSSMAACSTAFVHLAVNDLDAVAVDVERAVAAARRARLPLQAIRARLMLAEAERRRGRAHRAAMIVARLRRLDASCLPPILRARCDLIAEAASDAGPIDDLASRHRVRTGLGALSLFVAGNSARGTERVVGSLGDAIVSVLRICQNAEEDGRLLAEVCASLRRELRAAAVAFVGLEGPGHTVVASDGTRVDTALALRVVTSDLTIAPHLCDGRVEAGAPVRYGGRVKGALIARWPLGTPDDLSRSSTLLTAAATAAAPALAAALSNRARPDDSALGELLGVSTAMADLRRNVRSAAQAPFAVLIEGESGSGKELIARAIHRLGPRRERAFSTLNCAALPDELVEAELFGHTRGAFTGAVGDRTGVFEEAHGGTLFLDEVGELSPRAQAKLLRVIQEGELRRIGENLVRRVDVRVVAATNRDLRAEVTASRFRLDLLYRLDVVRINVPALRLRREDIPVLAEHFWREATSRLESRATLAAATLAALAHYDWPGNVRELQNVLAALAVRSPRRGVVPVTALPPAFGAPARASAWRLDRARQTFEEQFVRAALARSGGRRVRAAEELGVTRQGLTKLLTRLGIRDRPAEDETQNVAENQSMRPGVPLAGKKQTTETALER